jgi:hypothetical protein
VYSLREPASFTADAPARYSVCVSSANIPYWWRPLRVGWFFNYVNKLKPGECQISVHGLTVIIIIIIICIYRAQIYKNLSALYNNNSL